MMNPELLKIETELKKRIAYPYKWGRKQNDEYDRLTNFVYGEPIFDNIFSEIKAKFGKDRRHDNISNYALNRWYNFWSAYAVEKIFCSMPNVVPALDEKDRLVDFTIQGAKFDHKTSIFPSKFPYKIAEAIGRTKELIEWLYRNQSQQQRKHLKNRLFIVLYSADGNHWHLKAEITWLHSVIERYMLGFNPDYLLKFSFEPGVTAISDVIWAIKL